MKSDSNKNKVPSSLFAVCVSAIISLQFNRDLDLLCSKRIKQSIQSSKKKPLGPT